MRKLYSRNNRPVTSGCSEDSFKTIRKSVSSTVSTVNGPHDVLYKLLNKGANSKQRNNEMH